MLMSSPIARHNFRQGDNAMKKRMIPILTLLLLLTVVLCCGCAEKQQAEEPSTVQGDTQAEPTQPAAATAEPQSEVQTAGMEVENYKLDGARTYTGTLVNGQPEGQGILVWDTGCIYRGEFKNGVYDGMGSFDWRVYNEDGTVQSEGWLYEGEFKNGTMAGCRGKLTLDQTNTQEGLIWIEGEMSGFPEIKKNQMAVGFIRYGVDNSTYEGEIYYDHTGAAQRKGYGIQDFSQCNLGYGSAWGCAENELFYAYEGEFDYSVSGWIFGNGIMYYKDLSGNPVRFAKGFYSACHLLGEYTGSQELHEGYTEDMGSKYIRFRENYDRYLSDPACQPRHVEYLFAGASYFTFMNTMPDTPFSKYYGEFDALDVGCGGSTTGDWLNYYQDLVKPYTPDNIVISLGGNDVSNGSTPERVYENLHAFIEQCKADNPDVKIYLVGAWITPSTLNSFSGRQELNDTYYPRLAKDFADTVYIPVEDLLWKDATTKTPVDDLASYFLSDGLHMNDKGYLLWTGRIKEYLK